MKYIIMCGGSYPKFKKPKQLLKVCGEVLVERTIRLLRENGITDIAISTNNLEFNYLDVEILHHNNDWEYWGKEETKASSKCWLNAYYPIEAPVCYLHGDVYFSNDAIKTIVNTKVKDTMFFCSYDKQDGKKDIRSSCGREPFAYKVENYKLFRNAINDLMRMIDNHEFNKMPVISWNVYRYLNGLDLGKNAEWFGGINNIFKSKGDYIVINDYTNDIDDEKDIEKIEKAIGYVEGGNMKNYKVKALKKFDDYEGKEVNSSNSCVARKVGEEFLCDKERYEYLKSFNVIELIEIYPDETKPAKVKEPKIEVELNNEIKLNDKVIKKTIKKKNKKLF